MEVYDDLVSAISNQSPADKRRIYTVRFRWPDQNPESPEDFDVKYVIATSPAQATLAVIGEHNVAIVSQRERYDATRQALHETLEAHNRKVDAKKGDVK